MAKNIDLESAVDKKLIGLVDNWGEYILVFEDSEFVVLSAQGGDCDEDPCVIEDTFHLSCWMSRRDELVDLGVVSLEQVEQERKSQREKKERQLRDKKAEVERLERELEGE